MRTLIVKLLLRLLARPYYEPLSKKSVSTLIFNIANEEGFERFPEFLQQCADTYRNQFLYTKDERFRGAVLAFTSLREMILEKKTTVENKKNKKNLTEDEKPVKIKKVSY